MVRREIAPVLVKLFGQYPVVTVTGPRQSGKTTLCRETFPHLTYVNLEAHDRREFAERDPRGFLAQVGVGAFLDEIQRYGGGERQSRSAGEALPFDAFPEFPDRFETRSRLPA